MPSGRNRSDLRLSPALNAQTGPVRIRMRETGPNHAIVEMGVDYSRAEIPDRSYYADYCSVSRARIGYTFVFGKLSALQDALRTKIEVIFPEQMFQQQVWGSTTSLRQTLTNARLMSSPSTLRRSPKRRAHCATGI